MRIKSFFKLSLFIVNSPATSTSALFPETTALSFIVIEPAFTSTSSPACTDDHRGYDFVTAGG